jgi:carbonic anhydrase
MPVQTCDCDERNSTSHLSTRREVLRSTLALLPVASALALSAGNAAAADALTREQRDKLLPEQIIEAMKQGNERFRTGRLTPHDYLAQKRATATGQYPAAVILSCIDSRAPAEILLDTAIGNTFNARIAGNVINDDLLGSMEFACALAGAKVVLVMGHTSCGAVKGAIDGAELAHLTGLLQKIKPAIAATTYTGQRTSANPEFVDAVTKTNVKLTLAAIRARSSVLAKLESEGKIAMRGAMYQLVGGTVEFFTA